MKTATFYLLPDKQPVSEIPAQFFWAVKMAQQQHLQRQRVYVLCSDQQRAELMSELLWQLDTAEFLPHTLPGEGTSFGAPVAIGWQRPTDRRTVLINLCDQLPDWPFTSMNICDFVPEEEEGKVLARERYKQFRRLGFSLQTCPFTF